MYRNCSLLVQNFHKFRSSAWYPQRAHTFASSQPPHCLCGLVRPLKMEIVHCKPQIIRRICKGCSGIARMAQDTDNRHNSHRRYDVRHILRSDYHGDAESAPGASTSAKILHLASSLARALVKLRSVIFAKAWLIWPKISNRFEEEDGLVMRL